jgi:hypothetical protein
MGFYLLEELIGGIFIRRQKIRPKISTLLAKSNFMSATQKMPKIAFGQAIHLVERTFIATCPNRFSIVRWLFAAIRTLINNADCIKVDSLLKKPPQGGLFGPLPS